MNLKPPPGSIPASQRLVLDNPNCTYYWHKEMQEFPRAGASVDGSAVRISILADSHQITPQRTVCRRICIPSSIDIIGDAYFVFRGNLRYLVFEPGSSLAALGHAVFGYCSSLQSICIPSSIERISNFCFTACRNLSSVTFEPGSAISFLGDGAFSRCVSLKSLCLPAGVRRFSAFAIASSGIRSLTVDPENPFFQVVDDYLVDASETALVRYLGNETDLVIPATIDVISDGCFARNGSILSVAFASPCRVRILG
jgi:hypothetical protein